MSLDSMMKKGLRIVAGASVSLGIIGAIRAGIGYERLSNKQPTYEMCNAEIVQKYMIPPVEAPVEGCITFYYLNIRYDGKPYRFSVSSSQYVRVNEGESIDLVLQNSPILKEPTVKEIQLASVEQETPREQ
ncbi:hypothetical protein HZB02_02760 [Candidatus Woesearchaeota archaeon]|nr:hypothetical protein [Candidatus Woesearchaeota archaeon]